MARASLNNQCLVWLAVVSATLTTATGWWVVGLAVHSEGDVGSAAVVMGGCALLATVGLVSSTSCLLRGIRPRLAIVGLVAVGLFAPTAFAYLGNLATLALALVMVIMARRPASRSLQRLHRCRTPRAVDDAGGGAPAV